MPIYEFECCSCGVRFDRLQKLSDPDPDACPDCGAPQVRRCVTAPSFRLSGSGWYETDFKKNGDKKRNLTGTDEPPKADVAKADVKAPAKSGEQPAKPSAVAKTESPAKANPS
jgi:putative FmdB family regulatory protein